MNSFNTITKCVSGAKHLSFPIFITFLATTSCFAGSYVFTWENGFENAGVVPDGNVAGWSDIRTLSGITEISVIDVNVALTLSGGWNGDLYAYLTHSSGFSVLLNRAGRTFGSEFGYADAGLDLLFDDAAANGDFHLYQTIPGYAVSIADGSRWSPDARNVNSLQVLNTDARTVFLDSFNGLDPNGDWTLFLADFSNGEISTVTKWGLEIMTVPEPTVGSFMVLGGLMAAGRLMRTRVSSR